MPLTARDIEEEMRQLLGGTGNQPDLAVDVAYEKERLRQLGETMTPDAGDDLPKGTKVNFAPDAGVDVSAPDSGVKRMPIVPKVVQVPGSPDEDLEMAAAKVEDRQARAREAFERGSRELVAGLTRTQVAPTFKQPQTAVADLLAKRERMAQDAQRNEQNRLAGERVNFERAEAARKAALDAARRQEDVAWREKTHADTLAEQERDNAAAAEARRNAARHTSALESIAMQGAGIQKQEAAARQTERDEKRAANAVPLMGGTIALKPGLSDSERGQARTAASMWNAADEATANFQSALEDFARDPSPATKGRVTAALRTASSAFNSAIGGGAMSMDEARAMSEAMGGDLLSPTGLGAIAQKVLGDDAAAAATISNRVRAARAANRATALGRLKTYGDFSDGGGGSAPSSGRVIVSNGKETVEIDAADLSAAERDGFKAVR